MTEHLAEPAAMTAPADLPPVRVDVDVAVGPDVAFRAFTADFDRWWPRSHHVGTAELGEAVLEQRPGGRWYERGVDGSECEWGRVLEWDPPRRLVLGWHLDGSYTYRPEPERASRVEVTFTPLADGHTRVALEHHGFERHGAGADHVRGSVGNPEGGWRSILHGFASVATAA